MQFTKQAKLNIILGPIFKWQKLKGIIRKVVTLGEGFYSIVFLGQ